MSIMRSAPLLLLGVTISGWALLRGTYIAWASLTAVGVAPPPPAILVSPQVVAHAPTVPEVDDRAPTAAALPARATRSLRSARGSASFVDGPPVAGVSAYEQAQALLLARMISPLERRGVGQQLALAPGNAGWRRAALLTLPETLLPAHAPANGGRWALSGWLHYRPGDGGGALARTGLLGGSQAGLRLGFRPGEAERMEAFARLTAGRTLRDAEAVAGIMVQPVAGLPVRLTAERRQAIGSAGRSAFAAYATGGAGAGLPDGWRIDGYGAAGVVGLNTRDLFAEGSARIDRPVARLGTVTVNGGAGVWAAAQPGVARVDVGPSLAARMAAGDRTALLALDWRQRVAGQAAPSSGPAVTLVVSF